jgi:HSP20 family protein
MTMRFDPFQDLDRLAERVFTVAADMGQASRVMPVDLYRSGDSYVLHCDLPGIDPGSLDLGVDGRVLTVRAQRSLRTDQVEWLTQERATGTYARQFTLSNNLDLEHIEAMYTDGVLTLTLPMTEEAKPRRIPVTHRTESHALSAGD